MSRLKWKAEDATFDTIPGQREFFRNGEESKQWKG
jgi:hypothetical protein